MCFLLCFEKSEAKGGTRAILRARDPGASENDENNINDTRSLMLHGKKKAEMRFNL